MVEIKVLATKCIFKPCTETHRACKFKIWCPGTSASPLSHRCHDTVGEPGLPVSIGVRGHNCSIVLAEGPLPSALDHDFHVHGIVPSVSFVIDIPESPKESFYSGKAFVCLKDKVCQLSSPIRHSVELIKSKFCDDGKSILVAVMEVMITVLHMPLFKFL